VRAYDQTILDHYREVAREFGLSANATMADDRTRLLETKLIVSFFQAALIRAERDGRDIEDLVVADVGCGNGYSLGALQRADSRPKFIGFEFSPDLRALAETRFAGTNVQIRAADIRDRTTMTGPPVDILICQRVLINLLDRADQNRARDNIIEMVRAGGCVLFIEAFESSLGTLNRARAEFELDPLPPAHHNLYLPDEFFSGPRLEPWRGTSNELADNFLSTHFFVTRVLHPVLLKDKKFKRNSLFVSFMSQALKENVGDFSPVKAHAFSRI
jgi:SAM-dependent methyltransferase